MSPRAFSNGPSSENDRSEALPRRKVKTKHDHPMGTFEVQRVPVRSMLRRVDRLTGRDRSKLPLTDLQATLLPALTCEPAWPKALAERSGLSAKQVRSGLLALSAKDLAVHTSEGWRLP